VKALLRFKAEHGLTYPQLSRLLGLPKGYLKKLGCGAVKRVTADRALQIEKATRGEIRAEELVFPERHNSNSASARPATERASGAQ
jgi:DNA-binding transcriptional regulator YdaS (Cro superfamily)